MWKEKLSTLTQKRQISNEPQTSHSDCNSVSVHISWTQLNTYQYCMPALDDRPHLHSSRGRTELSGAERSREASRWCLILSADSTEWQPRGRATHPCLLPGQSTDMFCRICPSTG
ncbi:hypothetical protein JOB18_023284 [Solea senegalensis]|uniref:Uncharacterized protein n=1 Tax=Solea senegalensis TaxID=28829 RepID=A0AAV6RJB5_SOLSE|nr:hypothetical protein JOB18_023284 [Solea senegalensis]